MVPTIRIDDEVYRWLQSQADAFEDTPNSVLRRFLGLDPAEGRKTMLTKERRGEKTPQHAFREPLLKILCAHSGGMPRSQALKLLETAMADMLTDFDRDYIRSGTIRWQKSAEWEVRAMRQDGLLRPVSECLPGVWALTEEGRNAASELIAIE